MVSVSLISFFILLIIGMPVAHVVLGAATLGVLTGGTNPSIAVQQLFLGANSYLYLAVPFFIISGDIAAKGTTSQKLVNTINAFLGHFPGGLGIATIFSCALFGAITGSSIACVVAIGSLMLPKLDEAGYPKILSIGIITVAGTLGVMIPPSIPMLQISVVMGASVGEQFTAGFVPGLLTAIAMSLYVVWFAKKHNIKRQERMPMRQRLTVLKESFWALMYPVIILGSIYSGIATPTEAAVISVFYVLIVELFIFRTQPMLKTIRDCFSYVKASTVSAATLTLTLATAQVFVWFLTTKKVPDAIYNFIIGNVSSTALLWAGLCVLFFIVGCFTNVSTVIIILGPMLLPVLKHYGIDVVHFGIISIMMAQIGFVTPPFGLCLFVSMKQSGEGMPLIIRGAMPFLIIMIIVTVILIIFPQLSLFLPNLIFA